MPDPNMTALPASGSTSWYAHYSEVDEKVRTQMSPGVVHLDDFAGASDDDKLTAAFSYIAAQSTKPGLQLPGRNVTFTTTRTPFSGMRIYGASGRGPKNLEISSGALVPHKVTLNCGFGTSSWMYGTGTVQDIYVGDVAFQAGNSNAQFWHQPSGTMYPAQFDALNFYGFKHVFGTPSAKCLVTQVSLTGHWTILGPQDVQITFGGSEVMANWYLNIQGNGSVAGAGKYLIQFDSLQKSIFTGSLYATCVNGWRGIKITGGSSAYGNVLHGAKVEGANTGNPNVGTAIRIEGGGWSLEKCWFAYSMTAPSAGENGVIEQTAGNLDLDRATYARGSTAISVPLLYVSGGKYYLRAAASTTEETINVSRAAAVTNGSDSSVTTTAF